VKLVSKNNPNIFDLITNLWSNSIILII
jgi:hypothetical protein